MAGPLQTKSNKHVYLNKYHIQVVQEVSLRCLNKNSMARKMAATRNIFLSREGHSWGILHDKNSHNFLFLKS